MRVFFSYAREDEAIAHLLAYILAQHNIECLIDRALKAGTKFDTALQRMIRSADAVLVLLTESSTSSAWVNQEVGFSVACNKTIWPLAMAESMHPKGMLATTQSYSLFDWTNPSRTIKSLIAGLLEIEQGGQDHAYHKRLGLDRVITGKIERTKFIVEGLRRLLDEPAKGVTVYAQAAFSAFAVSDDPMYQEAGGHSDEYMSMLLEERRLFHQLILRPTTLFRMLLWPVRAYEEKYLAIRYKALLSWMREVRDLPNVQFLCAQYLGPNRYIVQGDFCVEGYKLHHTSGYEMSVVKYQQSRIAEAVGEFKGSYQGACTAGETKDTAIRRIEAMYQRVSQIFEDVTPDS